MEVRNLTVCQNMYIYKVKNYVVYVNCAYVGCCCVFLNAYRFSNSQVVPHSWFQQPLCRNQFREIRCLCMFLREQTMYSVLCFIHNGSQLPGYRGCGQSIFLNEGIFQYWCTVCKRPFTIQSLVYRKCIENVEYYPATRFMAVGTCRNVIIVLVCESHEGSEIFHCL
jgi:hypothetical protein